MNPERYMVCVLYNDTVRILLQLLNHSELRKAISFIQMRVFCSLELNKCSDFEFSK